MKKILLGYINECLLFRTDDAEFKKLGALTWLHIIICLTAIIYFN